MEKQDELHPRQASNFGRTLAGLREQSIAKNHLGHDVILSQSRLAELADFDHSYISRLETGTRFPTREAVDRLGKAMKLSAEQRDELLISAGFTPDDLTSLLTSESQLARVLRHLNDPNLPERLKESLRDLLKAVSDSMDIYLDTHRD